MSRQQTHRIDQLEAFFDQEFVHYDDLQTFWHGVLEAIWTCANAHVHPTEVRRFMDDFSAKVKQLELPAPSTRAK